MYLKKKNQPITEYSEEYQNMEMDTGDLRKD